LKASQLAAKSAFTCSSVGARPSVLTLCRAGPITVIDQNQAASGREAVRSSYGRHRDSFFCPVTCRPPCFLFIVAFPNPLIGESLIVWGGPILLATLVLWKKNELQQTCERGRRAQIILKSNA
jgi:hypothetical protein